MKVISLVQVDAKTLSDLQVNGSYLSDSDISLLVTPLSDNTQAKRFMTTPFSETADYSVRLTSMIDYSGFYPVTAQTTVGSILRAILPVFFVKLGIEMEGKIDWSKSFNLEAMIIDEEKKIIELVPVIV